MVFLWGYENIMNNFVQYVSYGCCGRNSGSDLSYSSGAGDDSNTNDDDDDDNEFDDDEEGDLFWLKEFYRHKLMLCTTRALDMFYNNYIYREPCIVSYNTRMRWLNEILNGHWICCVNKFRMDASMFQNLCFDLEM